LTSPYGPILIVDDDVSTRELVTALVDATGHTAVTVDSGEAALAWSTEHRPALVLLDVCLPGISGYEVCRRLKEHFGPRLPVIFLSGERAEPHDRVAGLLLGADDYVVKPFFPDELAARIRALLARSGLERIDHAGPVQTVSLTRREREVLQLLAEGLTQNAIANDLCISAKTVGTHIQRILTKLGVHSRAEAVAVAYRLGIAGPDATPRALTTV
jgi:DNA-binding NarL/FixJ family response regulator